MELRHHVGRKLLYHRQIDDSPGTIATDFVFGALMLAASAFLAYHVLNSRLKNARKRSQRAYKSESGDEMIKNDKFAQQTSKLGESVETYTAIVISMLFSYGLMFFIGGFIHNDVQGLDLDVEGRYARQVHAYNRVFPYKLLWSFCCLCAGLVGCFFVLMCGCAVSTRNEICRSFKNKDKKSFDRNPGFLEATENAVGLLTKSVAIVIFLTTAGSELHKIVSFYMRKVRNQELFDLFEARVLSPEPVKQKFEIEGFKNLDWSKMWPMFLPTIMLLSANLVHALLTVYLQIRNSIQLERMEGEILDVVGSLNRGLWAQSIGSAVMCLGGILQVSLATCTDMSGHHHDHHDDAPQACKLPWQFNHNAIYHITTGVGALILASGQFFTSKICGRVPIGRNDEVEKEFVVEL